MPCSARPTSAFPIPWPVNSVSSRQHPPLHEPGQVVDVDEETIVVALKGGALKIGKMKGDTGAKLNAGVFAREMDLKVGMRFGT